ncbi:MAG: putative amidoligase domain-containing protein [Chitinophagaceae bacterium]
MINNITIGADPEVFLFNEDGFMSAEGLIGGTKEKPRKIERKGFAVQEDNVMVEFNIPPASTSLELQDNLGYMVDFLTVAANQFGCTLNKSAAAEFDLKYLRSEQAMRFGCDPDYNAYTMEQNPGIIVTNERLRTCGGHVHVGYDNPTEEDSVSLIRALDITLGLPSILKDHDIRRRAMYGKAGAYRLQPFGVEYRTLSNFWIFNNKLIDWVFEGVHTAANLVSTEMISEIGESEYGPEIQKVINKNDKKMAFELIKNISKIIKTKVCADY